MIEPFVSILMTSYNREKYIGEAIESILASTYTNYELIIVDDCSIDSTVAIAKSYEAKDKRIRVYVNEQNLGDYHNRNKAASYAQGKYLKYLDSDDLIYPHSLAVMVKAMETYPDAAVGVVGNKDQDDTPYPFLLTPKESYIRHFFKQGLFSKGPTGVIFKHAIFKEIGGFSGKRYIGDNEINLRIGARWPFVIMQSSLIYWRTHEGQEYVQGEIKTTGHLEATLPMLQTELNKPECPLNKQEVTRILKYYQSSNARHLLRIAIKEFSPRKSIKLYKQLSLTINDIFNAFFLRKKL